MSGLDNLIIKFMLAVGTEEGGMEAIGNMVNGKQSGSSGLTSITTSVQNGGNDLLYILLLIAAFLGAAGLIISFIKIMAGGSASKSEAKGQLVWIILAIIGAAASVGAIGVLFAIGGGLFKKETTEAGGFIMPMLPYLQMFIH